MKKRFLALTIAVAIAVSVSALCFTVSAYTTPSTVNETQVMSKIKDLANKLGISNIDETSHAGKHFTVTGETCSTSAHSSCSNGNCRNANVFNASWFTTIFGTVSTDQIPGHAYPNGSAGYPTGSSCHGFANFAQWYIFSTDSSNKVTYERIIGTANDYSNGVKFSKSVLDQYAKPGDIIRDWKSTTSTGSQIGHSYIYVSHDSEGAWVLDSNYYNISGGVAYNVSRVQYHKILYTERPYPIAISRATNYDVSDTPATCTKTQYRYYHYTDKAEHYSVCGSIIGKKYGTVYRHSTGWIDTAFDNMVSNSATSYYHGRVSDCDTYGCIDETWTDNGAWEAPCAECGVSNARWYRVETQTVEAHNYTSKVTSAATCTATGVKTYTCTDCGNSYTETIAKLGHNFSSSYTTDKAATCTTAGSKSQHCSRCSATQNVTSIPATGHSYSTTSAAVAATCTKAGKTAVEKCSKCSATKGGDTIAALGHNFSSSYTTDKAATCTTAGSKSQHCSRCSATQNVTSIPATGHSYSTTSAAVAATCTKAGKTAVEKCSKCSATKGGDTIAALGHNFSSSYTTDKAATCTTAGSKSQHCSRCSATQNVTVIPATSHSFGAWTVTTPAQVGVKGEETRICTKCPETEKRDIPALEPEEPEIPEGALVVSASDVRATAGGTVKVNVTLENNIYGIGGTAFNLNFDTEYLTLTDISLSDGFSQFLVPTVSGANASGVINFAFVSMTMENLTGEGKIATLTFTVNEDAPVCTLPLTLSTENHGSFYYEGQSEVDLDLASGDGEIKIVDVVIGDPTGDGIVNVRDAARVLQYLAGWDVEITEAAADVTGDGIVNVRDAARILQYLAGWDVTLG